MDHVSVILPTYNESGNIGKLIEGILLALREYPGAIEVLVVDDDSPDGTWQIVEQMAKSDARVVLHRRIGERGLTSAIWSGIQRATGSVVVWMDCDLSMPPERIPALLAELADPVVSIAVGSRYVPGGEDIGHSLVGQLFSRAINVFAGLFLGFDVHDYTTGFVAARRTVFDAIALRGDYGEYCIDFLYRAKRLGYRIVEVPYSCVERASGESKTALNLWGYVRRGVKYITTVWRLRFSPLP